MAPPPWDFMRVWWDELTRYHALRPTDKPVHGSQRRGFRALTLQTPAQHTKKHWIEQRDAMELVLLQLAVDERAFMEMARERFDDPFSGEFMWRLHDPDAVIPCGVELLMDSRFSYSNYGKGDTWEMWLLSSLLTPVALKKRRKSFLDARSKILEMADEDKRREVGSGHWTIPVHVEMQFDSKASEATALELLAQHRQAMDAVCLPSDRVVEERRRAALRIYPFRVATVDVSLVGFSVTKRLNEALEQVVKTKGLEIRNVHYSSLSQVSRPVLGVMAQHLMKPRRHHGDIEANGSLTLAFPDRGGQRDISVVESAHLLSALLSSDQFDSVIFTHAFDSLPADERRLAWLWITHTLFSSFANRNITKLELAIERVTDGDVAAIRSYMEAKNPVSLLCYPSWRFETEEDPTSQPRKRVALEADITLLLSLPKTRSVESAPLSVSGWFDVIQEDDDFVDVVVPAYGQCRVRKGEVSQWEELPQVHEGSPTLNSHYIKSLHLLLPMDEMDPLERGSCSQNLRALLELVGQPFESLQVEYQIERGDIFLDAVWAACPNLKMLKMDPIVLPSLDYIIEAYESGTCRVESMGVCKCLVEVGSSRMRLFEALEGPQPRTKIASTLRELIFSEEPEDRYEFLTVDEMKDIAAKLDSNQMLRFVRLGAMDAELEEVEAVLEPLDGRILRGQSVPLSIRHKCALLSFIQRANDPIPPVAIPAAAQVAKLDGGVLSNIMAFAAHSVKRSISVQAF